MADKNNKYPNLNDREEELAKQLLTALSQSIRTLVRGCLKKYTKLVFVMN